MLGQISLRPSPETRYALRESKSAISALHTPGQNPLLAALPLDDYERLLSDLQPIPLPLGWIVHDAADREKYLDILTAGIVSRFYVMENGASAEFAVTGSEGKIGVASLLGGESALNKAVVLSAGNAYELGANLLKIEFEHGGAVPRLLLRYTQALIVQTGEIVACNRHHSAEQQLCRGILSCLNRLPSNELTMTPELIADMLGVRREGIMQAAGKLQERGLIHCDRGHITVLDRPRLEAWARESEAVACYAVIKREHGRLPSRRTPFAPQVCRSRECDPQHVVSHRGAGYIHRAERLGATNRR